MMYIQAFKMSVKAIMGSKARSILTMLGVVIGIAAVITLVSLVQGMQNQYVELMKKMGTNKVNVYASTWGGKDFTQELHKFCLGMEDVEGVTPSVNYWAQRVKYKNKVEEGKQVMLGSDAYSVCNNFEIEKGRDITYVDVVRYNRVAVLGAGLADALFDYKNPLGETIMIDGSPFTVVGVYKQKFNATTDGYYAEYDNIAVVPYTMNTVLLKNRTIEQFIVKAVDSDGTKRAEEQLREFLATKYVNEWEYSVYSENEYIQQQDEYTNTMSLILAGIAAISLLVGGIGIMNIMLVTVTERTREIGIRKAIGAERRSIIAQFLVESGIISLMGGVIGVGIGFLLTVVLGKMYFNMLIFPGMEITGISVAFSIALGMIFGIYPAAKASKLQPVDALRTE